MTPSFPARKRKFLITLFLFSMCCCNMVLLYESVPKLRRGYQDFTIYYTGGMMLREGRAAALYDLEAQYQTQLRFCDVPIRHGALPFNHPAFEALMFVPFTLLSFWHAYLLWTALSLGMLAASVVLLRRFPAIRAVHPGLLAAGALSFFPLVNGMLQGQDSILLMFLTVVALTCLDRGADVTAGAWLGLGLFRPHMALPLALLLAVRRWRLLWGFVPVMLVLAGLTVAATGWGGVLTYVRFVSFVEHAGIGNFGPQVTPNLRGLIEMLLRRHVPASIVVTGIAVLSLVVLAVAAARIHNGSDGVAHSFGMASVATILVSFHAHSYELTLLLPLVLFLLAAQASGEPAGRGIVRSLLVVLLFLTPAYVFLLFQFGQFFWFAFIVLWMFFRLVRQPPPAQAPV